MVMDWLSVVEMAAGLVCDDQRQLPGGSDEQPDEFGHPFNQLEDEPRRRNAHLF